MGLQRYIFMFRCDYSAWEKGTHTRRVLGLIKPPIILNYFFRHVNFPSKPKWSSEFTTSTAGNVARLENPSRSERIFRRREVFFSPEFYSYPLHMFITSTHGVYNKEYKRISIEGSRVRGLQGRVAGPRELPFYCTAPSRSIKDFQPGADFLSYIPGSTSPRYHLRNS